MSIRMSRADLEAMVQTYRTKALQEHDEMRRWQNRALAAEQRLAEMIQSNPPTERNESE